MAEARSNIDSIDTMLDRLVKATDQITKASKKQQREIDRQLKRLIDHGEATTERMLKAVDKELRDQITSLRTELRDVERRVGEMRKSVKATASKHAPAKKAATKKAATKKAPDPGQEDPDQGRPRPSGRRRARRRPGPRRLTANEVERAGDRRSMLDARWRPAGGGPMVERLNGLDTGMLAGETPEWHMHAGALALLEPTRRARPRRRRPGIHAVLNARRELLGPFRHRLLEAPLGPRALGLDRFRRTSTSARRCDGSGPAPGGIREGRDARRRPVLVPAEPGGPLWEIWVLEGLEERPRRPPLEGAPHAHGRHPRRRVCSRCSSTSSPTRRSARPDGDAGRARPRPVAAAHARRVGRVPRGDPAASPAARRRDGLGRGQARRVLASPDGRAAALPFRAPAHLLNQPFTSRRSFAFASVSLEDMRTVKHAFGVTMNDVALALERATCCAGIS